MNKTYEPIVVEFPLRGEWLSPNTPGTKIPSHGTNKFGTRFAYDFVKVDWNRKGLPAYRGGLMKYLFRGIPKEDYLCWGQIIYSPCDGVVVRVEDGFEEREKTNLCSDMRSAYRNAHYFDPTRDNLQIIAGNYIIIKIDNKIYAALCHIQNGSIKVSENEKIMKGQVIGRVGHSGNSFAPHLHFQLMDSCDITTANGLPCAFEQYELYRNGIWVSITNGIPFNKDRIRF